jgi:L-amino acid N-acyltransferase YncA
MTMTTNGSYPTTLTLRDGTTIGLRLMTRADRDPVLAFARGLAEEDLLFLRVDITRPEVVDAWIANLEAGTSTTILAAEGDRVAGYATVHTDPTPWTRRVGEIRVNVGGAWRTRGLGRHLTAKVFDLARSLELRKLMATMTADQLSAQAVFKRLGFMPEALLADFVEDRKGSPRDLVIMSYDLDGLTDQIDEPLRV